MKIELKLKWQLSATIQVSFAVIQSVCTLGICLPNHYLAFFSHVAFLPSPGGSVMYRASTTLDPITSLYFINDFGMSPAQIVSPNQVSP